MNPKGRSFKVDDVSPVLLTDSFVMSFPQKNGHHIYYRISFILSFILYSYNLAIILHNRISNIQDSHFRYMET